MNRRVVEGEEPLARAVCIPESVIGLRGRRGAWSVNVDDLIGLLRSAAQRAVDEAQRAEVALIGASSREDRTRAMEAALRLLRRLDGSDRPGRPMAEGRDALRAEARDLRAEGHSLGQIARMLDVPRATVQRWTQGPTGD
jgi:hypothetical protein